ncbi:MAG: cysteine desulfurase [Muribaculaceae bacterium]|nr:cysteine desulfurase [Bacteroidales bacterium]MDY4811911.1 cysteine desulfurase [Muribaculaceae bacterium]
MLDIKALRRQYPILERKVYGKPMIYLDNSATTQTPLQVVDAIRDMYLSHKANVHRGVFLLAQEATELLESARTRVQRYINAPSREEVIFTRGTTEGINLVASSLGQLLTPGDEVILTVMEHHANIVPWQLLQARKGIVIKVVPILPDGSLDLDAFRSLFTQRTRVASFCHVSNVLGTVNPVKEMAAYAHEKGACVVVDGAQAVPHFKIDVQELGADFYAFSAHKMYGPQGIGILWGRREWLDRIPPYQGGGEMIKHVSFSGTTFEEPPLKFEAGTPDFVDIAALTSALDYIDSIGIEHIEAHENELMQYATAEMMKIPGMRIFGTAPGKAPVISFLVGDAHHYDTGMLLDKLGVAVRTGHHCAQPLMESLGIEGTVRASFALYNTRAEVNAFLAALHRILPLLGVG